MCCLYGNKSLGFFDKIKHKSEQDIIVSQLFLIILPDRPW